jgi:monovalent cation/hydrogen antiporter
VLASGIDPDSEALRQSGDSLKFRHIGVQRERLTEMRFTGAIEDDIYHAVKAELAWAEMAVTPPEKFEILEG